MALALDVVTPRPVIDQWYQRLDTGERFRVVALDANGYAIATQDFDGNLAEFDADAWKALELEEISAPEDWTGPFDDVQADDAESAAGADANWQTRVESVQSREDRWREASSREEAFADPALR